MSLTAQMIDPLPKFRVASPTSVNKKYSKFENTWEVACSFSVIL